MYDDGVLTWTTQGISSRVDRGDKDKDLKVERRVQYQL
jgi:hypothetical protein